jgi:hypothetical protein
MVLVVLEIGRMSHPVGVLVQASLSSSEEGNQR